MPLTPTMPIPSSLTALPIRRVASTTLAHQVSGAPSAQPGCGVPPS